MHMVADRLEDLGRRQRTNDDVVQEVGHCLVILRAVMDEERGLHHFASVYDSAHGHLDGLKALQDFLKTLVETFDNLSLPTMVWLPIRAEALELAAKAPYEWKRNDGTTQ